ncbi:unnamed protein product [Ixodes persulcatus]
MLRRCLLACWLFSSFTANDRDPFDFSGLGISLAAKPCAPQRGGPLSIRSWFQVADTKRHHSPIPQELRTHEGLPAVKSNLVRMNLNDFVNHAEFMI